MTAPLPRPTRCTCIADPCECAAIIRQWAGRAPLTHEQRDRFRAEDARFDAVVERVGESLDESRRWIAEREGR